jgi:RNA polymerase sigma-70 factor (ECF subfamily)
MPHEPRDWGEELERYRDYLALLARLQLAAGLQGKVDLSGVVQQTLWEAYQALESAPDRPEAIQAAWLRQILANNLRDEVRKLGTAARAVDRERSLQAALDQSTPSQRAIRQEELLALAAALARLPPDQRSAVELHHLKGCPLADVAWQLGRSKGAVAQLLFRGLQKLRELLSENEEHRS